MLQLPLYKRILSYITPVMVHKTSSAANPVLEVLLYKGQFQLTTEDAIYSDGSRYRPLVAAFKKIKPALPRIKTALMLGTGIGSGVQILGSMGCRPSFTLIEKDPVILQLAREILGDSGQQYTYNAIAADAAVYIQQCDNRYDLLVVDIFIGQEVPGFVTTTEFLKKCLRCINTEGIFVLNYISANEKEWAGIIRLISGVFPMHEVISFGVNRIIIATV